MVDSAYQMWWNRNIGLNMGLCFSFTFVMSCMDCVIHFPPIKLRWIQFDNVCVEEKKKVNDGGLVLRCQLYGIMLLLYLFEKNTSISYLLNNI